MARVEWMVLSDGINSCQPKEINFGHYCLLDWLVQVRLQCRDECCLILNEHPDRLKSHPILPIFKVQTYPLLSVVLFSIPHFWSCLVAHIKLKAKIKGTWNSCSVMIKKAEWVGQLQDTCIESISDVSNQLCVLSHLDVWYTTSNWSFWISFRRKWFGSGGSLDWRHVRHWQSSDNTYSRDNRYVHAPLLLCYSLFNLGLQGWCNKNCT